MCRDEERNCPKEKRVRITVSWLKLKNHSLQGLP
jgi:hypothetical protein